MPELLALDLRMPGPQTERRLQLWSLPVSPLSSLLYTQYDLWINIIIKTCAKVT